MMMALLKIATLRRSFGKVVLLGAAISMLLLVFGWNGHARAAEAAPVVILTDIGQDPDDQQSLVRALLYSNSISIRGIVATYVPRGSVRTDIVLSMIAAYKKDLPSLRRNASGYPSAELLASRVRAGLDTNTQIGAGYDSPGSNLIVYVVDHSAKPVWVLVWGGSRELAQALYKVKTERSPADYQKFQQKLRTYTIEWSQYTPEPAEWMAENAKDMFWIASIQHEAGKSGTYRGMYLDGDNSMQDAAWLRANILNHGNLGQFYPLNTTERGLKEGDSPSLLHILPVGLGDPELPRLGSWGGRYTKEARYYKVSKNLYTSELQQDTVGGVTSRRLSVARWRIAYQRDFAARAMWLDTSYADANHPPRANVPSDAVTVRSGDKVYLDGSKSSDPDGDPLRFKWWIYGEAGSYAGSVPIDGDTDAQASLMAPAVSSPKTLHVILEVTDDAAMPMTRYQRIVVTVQP